MMNVKKNHYKKIIILQYEISDHESWYLVLQNYYIVIILLHLLFYCLINGFYHRDGRKNIIECVVDMD